MTRESLIEASLSLATEQLPHLDIRVNQAVVIDQPSTELIDPTKYESIFCGFVKDGRRKFRVTRTNNSLVLFRWS